MFHFKLEFESRHKSDRWQTIEIKKVFGCFSNVKFKMACWFLFRLCIIFFFLSLLFSGKRQQLLLGSPCPQASNNLQLSRKKNKFKIQKEKIKKQKKRKKDKNAVLLLSLFNYKDTKKS
jgi:hypothetical protein